MKRLMKQFKSMKTTIKQAFAWITSLVTATAFVGLTSTYAWAISVSISDNVVVLDTRERSGEIELLSMTPSAVEFEISAMDLPEGLADGRQYLRWSPERVLVPANRATPLRMVFRPPADLEAGEYIVRLAVLSRRVDFEPDFGSGDDEEEIDADNALAVGVAIQPMLPVTVYIRHMVDSPELVIGDFVPAEDDDTSHGHFMVEKHPDAISFVGTVALIGANTGNALTSGRLRMAQTANQRRIRVPRDETEAALTEPVCLHVWPSFPPRGEPERWLCSE